MMLRAAASRVRCRRRVRGPGNSIRTQGAVLRRVRFDIEGRNNHIEIGANTRVSDFAVTLRGDGHRLEIGAGSRIWSGTCNFYDAGGTVRVGDHTSIYGAQIGVSEGGTIGVGRNVLIASGCDLRNGDSHSILDEADGSRLNPAADVVVGDHVWLAERVMVLKGSRIGCHTVVGAGSIVSGDLPGHCVAVGAPARPRRTGVTWTAERR